ncbi:MAG: carbohydrate kinase family protein [Planctomycetota bacterium]
MSRSREQVANDAAAALRDSIQGEGSPGVALVGFDGFVDVIINAVDTRASMTPEDFTPIRTISGFAARCDAAAGKSANIEMHVVEERFGGNGPLMAGGLARLGATTDYIGGIGETDPSRVHPLFEGFAERCREVVCIGPPGHTDALEFEDGKLMLGKPANMQAITWDLLRDRVGVSELARRCEEARLFGIVNWTLSGGVQGIWEGLIAEVLGRLDSPPGVFIDLSDPAKRTDADVKSAMECLGRMNALAPVTLGLNLAESERMDRVLGCGSYERNASLGKSERVSLAAEAIREAIGLDCVVVHPRDGAAAAEASGASAWFDGPFTREPKLSTGAGDHFNAGFAHARTVLGLPIEESLAIGCGTSGAYVRDAESPTSARVCELLEDLPPPAQA